MTDLSKLKVVIVHDWLIGGGAEKVVLELHHLFPEAPIYTSYATDEWRQKLNGKVVTGYLQHWPFSKLRKFLPPLRAAWFSHLKLDSYDLVLSSSGAEAKGIKTSKNTLHVNYCHAPTHYYWARYDDYLKNPGFGPLNWLGRFGLKLLVGPMRRWDYKAAQRPDVIIANSSYTQANIKKYYGRDSQVIHPPVEVDRFKPKTNLSRRGFVITGRQAPYKRIDLAVVACSQLDLPLEVIGRGPEHRKLVQLAGPSISFVTGASDLEVADCLVAAQAFIFPGVDDFGISAVEAMAAGTPVIAYKAGGALDYIEPAKTGLFFDAQNKTSLVKTLQSFDYSKFDSAFVSQQAYKYNPQAFRKNLQSLLNKEMKV